VVTGDHKVGAALCASKNIHKISFTGGSETGRIVMTAAAQNLVPVTLELGGKSPNIIFADANLKRAVTGAIAGVFAATGQTCMAGSRLLIQQPIAAQVLNALVGRAKGIRMGDPRDPETEMGPLCSAGQRDRVLSMVAQARADGARLLTGGDSPLGLGSDLFVSPTVFDQVLPNMALFRKEVFGPVVAVLPFTDEEQALALANDSDFGLVAGIWTQDISRAHRMAKALEVGTVWINTYRMSVPQAPAGGIKQSGFGKERGWLGLMEYIKAKNVMLDYSDLDRDPFTIQTQ
jgi:aldehyde dehydrogenase (NAD+)